VMAWKFASLLVLLPVLLPSAGCDACTGALGACGPAELRYEGEVRRLYPDAAAPNVRVEFTRTGGAATDERVLEAVSDNLGRFFLEGSSDDEGDVVGDLSFYPPGLPAVHHTGVVLSATRSVGGRMYLGSWAIAYPHLPYEARFFDRITRSPLPGIEVEFRRTGGIEVEPDTFTVTTNAFGTVKLRPLTQQAGELRGELLVKPLPPHKPYLIPGIRMRTFTEARNDSTIVDTGVGPHLAYSGILVWERGETPAAGVQLELRRTGGILFTPETFVTETDASGTFRINPVPLAAGILEADLVVRSPQSLRGTVVQSFRLSTVTGDGAPQFMGYFTIPGSAPRGLN
jgi:hypothetical protein